MENYSWLKDLPPKAIDPDGKWFYLTIEANDKFFRIFYKHPNSGVIASTQDVFYDFSNLDLCLNLMDKELAEKGFLFLKKGIRG